MNWIKNITVVFFAIIISFAVGEVSVRTLWKMEIIGSTRVADKFIGWKNTDIYGGNNGFRQQSGTISNFYLAAIGDSFTYGYSVKNDETWPAVLKSLTNLEVYNFGVGGNGIFSYHYIVNNMIPKNKKIIIGLFLGNDFINKGYACNIDFNTDFWMKEVERLSLVKPTCATSNKKQTQLNFFHKLINHSAFVNRIYDIVSRLVMPSKRYLSKFGFFENKFLVFSDGLDLSLEETIGYARLTNTKNPETSSMINNFKSFLNDYKEKNLSIAVIFLPSRLYLYQLMDPEQLSGPNLSNIPYHERDLELMLLNYCAEIELLCSSITPDLLNAFKKSLNNLPKSNFFPDNAHYGLEGYKIIGEKAA